MRTNNRRGPVKSLIAVAGLILALGLSGCGVGSALPFDLSNGKASQVSCDQVVEVSNTITNLANAAAPGDRNQLRRWSIDPDNKKQVADVQSALLARAKTCNKAAVPSATGTPTGQDCPAAFVQRDISDPETARIIKGGIDAETADESRAKWLALVGHSAPALRAYAVEGLKLTNVPDVPNLVAEGGTCLSREGQDLFNQVKGAVQASGTKFVDNPGNGFNTGWHAGDITVASQPGVSGNTKALVITLPSGGTVTILVRCGNLYLPGKPQGVPEGPTDNPEQPSCPPGWSGTYPNCLQPKNPGGAMRPSGTAAPVGGGGTTVNESATPPKVTPAPQSTYTPPPPPPPVTPTPTPRETQPPPPVISDPPVPTETGAPPPPAW